MARTIRRKAYGKRMNAANRVWNKQAVNLGWHVWDEPEWRIFSDAFGTDSASPFKRAHIAEHRSSVRRFVRDALVRGAEPVVCNERSRWYAGVGVTGTVVPVDGDDDGALFGEPIDEPVDEVCPPNTLCACGDMAVVAIRFSPDDLRFYCWPCS